MFKMGSRQRKTRFVILALFCFMLCFTGCKSEGNDSGADNLTTDLTAEENTIENLTSMAEGAMTYEQVQNAKENSFIVIEGTVKEKLEWIDYKGAITVEDPDGIYEIEDLKCSEEIYQNLSVGTTIRILGLKKSFEGNPVIGDAEFEWIE